ncbi:MAG: class I tRNA ligase family protein [Candidatus Peribacteria bacterium]|jgi:valyl-tRNA synthetase|nr:class I tRNA ligase family protein [Candidatus Peribacteria bacterium]
MANKYNFQEAEAKWQAFREEQQTNAFDLTNTDSNQIFSIDTPPPTVSGRLHIGHVFSYTQAEIIARYKRMKGFNVFYPMGYDDNGIPTEQLVERELKINIKEMERKDFVEACLKINQKYRDIYKALWQSLGFSIDWKRTYATILPEVQQLVQKRFVEMYKNGDIVGKKFPALRCTKMQTTVAQAETEEKEFNEFFNYLNFTLEDGEKLVIATTRPEMIPACVAVFAHPDDERFAKYIGRTITTPLGDTVPLLGDDKVKMDKGS